MRLRHEEVDPNDINTDFALHTKLYVEFDNLDDEVWCMAFNTFCNEGFEVDDEYDPQSNFTLTLTAGEDEEQAMAIVNEFHPEGTMIHITNYYDITVERLDTETVEFFFWKPRNPQSRCRLQKALAIWKLCFAHRKSH